MVSKRRDAGRSGYRSNKPCRQRHTLYIARLGRELEKFDGLYRAKKDGKDLSSNGGKLQTPG
jgi:hypothetical protein